MSVIENPVAYLNETHPEYEEPTPMTKLASSLPTERSSELLDETPLSSNRKRSPRQLSTEETSLSSVPEKQPLVAEAPVAEVPVEEAPVEEAPVEEAPVEEASAGSEEADSDEEETAAGESGEKKISILDLVEKAVEEEGEEEDEDFNPDKTEEEEATDDEGQREEEEEEEEESIPARSYSLRDGVRGTVEEKEEVKQVSHDEAEKKKADDLWSAFKADVAMPIKRKAKELESAIREKTYDFAGETVTVKEPDIMQPPSKRRSIASTLGFDRKRRRDSAPLPPRPTGIVESSEEGAGTGASGSVVRGSRPVSKLNSLVNRLTKKPKMTVLNKTALDWEKYKSEHKIEDDVKNEAKSEGYLEKQDFLNRSDVRQFELEREIRQQQQRRRQMMNSKQF